VAIGSDATRLATGDKLGGVSLLSVFGIHPGPAIVTAVRLWRFGPHTAWRRKFGVFSRGSLDSHPVAFCSSCESAFQPAAVVLEAIEAITRDANLKSGQAPAITLPREAWDEQRLISACPRCTASVRFSPFIA
jgi:hypothetical protein